MNAAHLPFVPEFDTEADSLRRQLESANKRASDWSTKCGTAEGKLAIVEEQLAAALKREETLRTEVSALNAELGDLYDRLDEVTGGGPVLSSREVAR